MIHISHPPDMILNVLQFGNWPLKSWTVFHHFIAAKKEVMFMGACVSVFSIIPKLTKASTSRNHLRG